MRNKLYRPYVAEMLRYERQQRRLAAPGPTQTAAADLRRGGQMAELRRIIGIAIRSPWRATRSLARAAQSLPIMVIGWRAF
jgi:hypothetical protein